GYVGACSYWVSIDGPPERQHANRMVRESIRRWVIWGLLLTVALMAFFPLPFGHGPFNSVNGPTTALRAYRSAMAILTALAMFAAAVVAILLQRSVVTGNERAEENPVPILPPQVFASCAILRC